MVGSDSKKRPDNLCWVRMFGGEVMEMLEMGVDRAVSMSEFKGIKSTPGNRPLFHFCGSLFDTSPKYIQFKSLLLDFYHGSISDSINLSGIEHVISVTICTPPDSTLTPTPITSLSSAPVSTTEPIIQFRVYSVSLLRSGVRQPIVSLSPHGPNFDFTLRRNSEPQSDMWKEAVRFHLPKGEGKKKIKEKNVDLDVMGDKIGRIHVGKQELGKLQSRKMKGLKRGRKESENESEGESAGEGTEEIGKNGEGLSGIDSLVANVVNEINPAKKRKHS